ncbi:conserved exported hypothetical protein [Frankia sp. AiPs1]
MHIGRCTTSLLFTSGMSVAAILLASPASAESVSSTGSGLAALSSIFGQSGLLSATVPVCRRPDSAVSKSGVGVPSADADSGDPGILATCYEIGLQYDPSAANWQPSWISSCTSEHAVTPAAEEGVQADQVDDWFANDGDDWFGDKDKGRRDVIIGSVTIGIGGPTVGGTGIVGGTQNTAGGTTAGFGGVTAGGTSVGGAGNTVTNSGTTINGAGAAAAAALPPTTSALAACDPIDLSSGTGIALGEPAVSDRQAADPDAEATAGTSPDVADLARLASAQLPATPASTGPTSSRGTSDSAASAASAGSAPTTSAWSFYQRGWRDGWQARGQRDGAAIAASGADSSASGRADTNAVVTSAGAQTPAA